MLKLKHEIRERESEAVEREEEERELERRDEEERLRDEEDDRPEEYGRGYEIGEGRGGKKEKEGGKVGGGDVFLGNSVLGGKKPPIGMAPVAPMVHTQKNAGVGGVGGMKRKFDGEE